MINKSLRETGGRRGGSVIASPPEAGEAIPGQRDCYKIGER